MRLFHTLEQKIGVTTLPLYWKVFFWIGIIAAFLLALIPLYYQFTFGYDQARDAYEAFSIWGNHDIKIIGPGTDFPGVYHGVLWFYLLAVYYGVGGGNPLLAGYINGISMLLSIFFVGYAARIIFNKSIIAASSMLLYAFSPLFQATTRWFSNPDPTIFVMPFLLASLWQYLYKKTLFSAFSVGISMGLIVQANFGYAMFYLLLPLYLLVSRRRPTLKELCYFMLGSSIALSTFVISEIKFNFRATIGVITFFLQPHTTSSSFLTTSQAVFEKYYDFLYQTILPFPWYMTIIVIIGMGVILYMKRKLVTQKNVITFFLLWLFNIVLFRVFNTGLTNSSFMFFPSIAAVVLLCSYFLSGIIENKKLLLGVVFLLIISQCMVSYQWIANNKTTLAVQHGITLFEEKKIIDYTYQAANQKPFTISTVSNPLFINTLWSYLYEFEGRKKYGYVPFFDGRSQKGYLGTLPPKNEQTEIQYLIFEPPAGIPEVYLTKAEYTLDQYTDVIEERKFGNFLVQKRIFHPNKAPIDIPPDLINSPVLHE